jgi:hypothetical protein
MTGDGQYDEVLRAGLSDRSQRFRATLAAGELRNRAKRIPNAARRSKPEGLRTSRLATAASMVAASRFPCKEGLLALYAPSIARE